MKISHGYFEGKKTFSCLGLFKKVFKSRTREHFSFTIPDDAIDGRKLGIKRITVAYGLNRIVYLNKG